METKTIKISKPVHKELKVFVANNGDTDNMIDFAGLAIMAALKERGHKFTNIKNKKDESKV